MAYPYKLILFTNRNCTVYDADGNRINELQAAISCYHIDPDLALRITREATLFEIAKWKHWSIPITRQEMQSLLGLRTRQMDLDEES